jgi:uncharacterized repeat protein (TIGR01451 family)
MFVARHHSKPRGWMRFLKDICWAGLSRWCLLCLALIACFGLPQMAMAQTVNRYTVANAAPGAAITDISCPTAASHVIKTFTVPTNFIVGDVDLGIYLTHTYRSDLIITLKAPGTGPTVTVMTAAGGSGDNLNDLFDDEAAAAFSTHNATATDTVIAAGATFPHYALSATFPYYQHSYRPVSPFSVFDGLNAAGTWTLDICDNVGADVGSFKRADLFLTSTSVSVTKSSSIISDNISAANPKAIPGATVQYCILVTGNGKAAAPNATVNPSAITPIDIIPATETFVPGSMLSGTTCATATTAEDADSAGADETDPFGMSITGSTITGRAASLAPGATFAMVFRATIN